MCIKMHVHQCMHAFVWDITKHAWNGQAPCRYTSERIKCQFPTAFRAQAFTTCINPFGKYLHNSFFACKELSYS